jgi:hypothetical protein
VVRLDSAEVLVLNEVGGRVVELLDGSKPLGGISAVIRSEFDVDAARADQDVLDYARELLENGLVDVVVPED